MTACCALLHVSKTHPSTISSSSARSAHVILMADLRTRVSHLDGSTAAEKKKCLRLSGLPFYVRLYPGSTSKRFPSKNESLFPACLCGMSVAHTADVLQRIHNSITATNVDMDIIFRPSLANGLNLCMPFWATKADRKHGV